jgi:hypothetical protein
MVRASSLLSCSLIPKLSTHNLGELLWCKRVQVAELLDFGLTITDDEKKSPPFFTEIAGVGHFSFPFAMSPLLKIRIMNF